jgi:HK97 family phage prohead protease
MKSTSTPTRAPTAQRERRFTKANFDTRDSGIEADSFTIKSHAAVFNEPCDFRYFKEYIAPGAFEAALAVKPLEVASNIQHNDELLLGHTLSGTLKLEEDQRGLLAWTRVAPTSYAADLRVSIDRGDMQQASFFPYRRGDVGVSGRGHRPRTSKRHHYGSVGSLRRVRLCARGLPTN